ncbi:MAG: hypothetical protein HQ592_15730 [Planctomycetes bacterium]|nr:hypothetical protein [Planctomycetota bacterium]
MIGGKTVNVVLPDIELKEVRNADGTPLLLADVFKQVLGSMGTSAFRSAKGIAPDDLLAGFGDTLGSAGKLLGDGGKAVQKLGEGLGGIGKDAFKGIFGGKKKKE